MNIMSFVYLLFYVVLLVGGIRILRTSRKNTGRIIGGIFLIVVALSALAIHAYFYISAWS